MPTLSLLLIIVGPAPLPWPKWVVGATVEGAAFLVAPGYVELDLRLRPPAGRRAAV